MQFMPRRRALSFLPALTVLTELAIPRYRQLAAPPLFFVLSGLVGFRVPGPFGIFALSLFSSFRFFFSFYVAQRSFHLSISVTYETPARRRKKGCPRTCTCPKGLTVHPAAAATVKISSTEVKMDESTEQTRALAKMEKQKTHLERTISDVSRA